METENKKSETRRRQKLTAIRMTDDEHARALHLAAEKGLSVAAYFRLRALGEIGERAQRQPRPGRQALAAITAQLQRLSAEHNKIGSNLNQLARSANTEGFEAVESADLKAALAEYDKAVAELGAMRALIMQALGYDL